MRLVELFEDYTSNLITDMENILITAKARGMYEVNTRQIVITLVNMGYSVDIDSIIGALQRSPMVQDATKQKVMLQSMDSVIGAEQSEVSPELSPEEGEEAEDETDDKVADMAQSALDLK